MSEPHPTRDEPMTYEAARRELAQVLERLEKGAPTLEESLQLWERGERLAALCQEWLDGARVRLDAVAPPDQRSAADRAPF